MIVNIRHKGLRLLYEKGSAKGVPAEFAAKLGRILLALEAGPLPDTVNLPGFGLHALTGERKGAWSVVVSRNWRVTFTTDGIDARDVDFEDYH